MNPGTQIIDWLYREQLQIDDGWAVRTDRGFTWWADRNPQSIEILGEEAGPDGKTGYLIGVRTEMVTDLDLTDAALAELNDGPMRFASMSGPVYDAETRTLSLRSLGRVYDEIADWMGVLLSAAAVTQLAEARMLAPALAAAVGARPAVSPHPQSGVRTEPDEMIFAAQVFVEEGRQPCQWPEADFDAAVTGFMSRPPSLGATAGGQGFTVEFPYGQKSSPNGQKSSPNGQKSSPNGQKSSLCQVFGTQQHPLYGNGLLVLQRFPFAVASEAKGAELALSLNAAEMTQNATGYGFGSYAYDNGMVCFTGFVPNSLHRQVVLPNLYFACAARAQAMSMWLLDVEWTADSFTPDHSAVVRTMMSDKGKG